MLCKNKFKYFILSFLITLLLFITPSNRALGLSSTAEVEDVIIRSGKNFGDPAYDSGWEDLGNSHNPFSMEFYHHLGGHPEDYLVDLSCKDDYIGVYNCTGTGFVTNAHWYDLTYEKVSVYADTYVDAVRADEYIEAKG